MSHFISWFKPGFCQKACQGASELLYDERISTFSVFNSLILNNGRCASMLSSLGPASGQEMQLELKCSERQERWRGGGGTRGRGPEREIEEDVSPGMHFNSLICPIFLCSFCLDDCGTLHIFTLEVHGEWGVGVEGGGVRAHMLCCVPLEHQGLLFYPMRWAQDCHLSQRPFCQSQNGTR